LPTRKFMRIAVDQAGQQPEPFHQFPDTRFDDFAWRVRLVRHQKLSNDITYGHAHKMKAQDITPTISA
jgi:hypothetical protein